MTLPSALVALKNYRQFIAYLLVPGERAGKMDKKPIDWRSGKVHDPLDPAIWSDYDTISATYPGRVGFVLTDQDPFWCLDIDNCLLPSGWSPLAVELCTAFPGAAIEVSQSGKGLHIFGTGQIPRHKNRDTAGLGLELYHNKRFIALGGMPGATGDANSDQSLALSAIVARYFAPNEADGQLPPEWTNEPDPEWNGSKEDEDLIRRMCASKSTASVFGVKATPLQLFEGDVAALSKAFPDSGNRAYDSSSADAALAQHLAFWTGKDCERMKRIMMMSKLMREKWLREDYLTRTILQAVAKQKEVCKDKPVELPTIQTSVQGPQDVQGETYLTPPMQKIMFEGCCYVADINKIIMPGGHVYKQDQFDSLLGGFMYVMDYNDNKTTISAWEVFTRSRAVRFDKAHRSSFRPDKKPGELWVEGNEKYVNTFWPVSTPCERGNPRPFTEHIEKLLPVKRDREIILAYMAAIVQHPGVKFQWAPLLQGTRGNGKTLLSTVLEECVGRKYCHRPKANEIGEKYNDWLENKMLICVEDIYVPKEKAEVLEIIKPMITSNWQEIRAMGVNKITRSVCCNFMLNSNHKDAIRMTEDNRGIAVFFTNQQKVADLKRDGMDGDYFPMLYNWLRKGGYAIVNDYLRNYPIPNELNPAGDCHRAPQTSSTKAAITESMGSVEQEIMACIEADEVGFRDGWISSHYLDQLLVRMGKAVHMSRSKRRDMIFDMGFMLHPGLKNGQVNNVVQPDGKKPLLFCRIDHDKRGLSGAAVARAYSDAQLLQLNPFGVAA
jgi:hypothetical protein